MNLTERINLIVSELNIKQADLIQKAGLEKSTVSNLINGNIKSPSFDKIEKIYRAYPQINAKWLLTGEGEMIEKRENPNVPNNKIMEDSYKMNNDNVRDYEKEITHLKELLIEKERLIQVLINK